MIFCTGGMLCSPTCIFMGEFAHTHIHITHTHSHTHTHTRTQPHTHTHTQCSSTPPSHSPQVPSSLFFQYNDQLGPPYHILVDTNFINFSIKNKLDMMQSFMDCLYAKCVPCVTDCVMGELEKLGSKFRVAQRIVKDARFERLPCMHAGTYADDCLVNRVTQVCVCVCEQIRP